MAVSDVQREGDNESRLRRDRLASSRSSDEAAAQNQELRDMRGASNEAARQNLQRFSGASWQPPTASGDAGSLSDAARQDRLSNQLNRDRRASGWRVKDAANAALAGADLAKTATMPARATPVGAAVGAGVDSATTGVKVAKIGAKALSKGSVDSKEISQMFGRGLVKILWQSLWVTFGHTVYFLAIIFLASSQSTYVRKWFPRIAEEWFPPDLVRKIPKAVMVPFMLAETMAVAFILFWVLLLDLTCLGLFALILGVIITAAS